MNKKSDKSFVEFSWRGFYKNQAWIVFYVSDERYKE